MSIREDRNGRPGSADDDAATEARLVSLFVQASALHKNLPTAPPWLVPGYVAKGAVTVLAGRPKVGKSTLVKRLAVVLASGEGDFLGLQVEQAPVMYATEEGAHTFLAGIPPLDHLWVLTRERAYPKPPWEALVKMAARAAEVGSASLLVIDSAGFFWSLLEENDAAAAQRAMEPLLEAASAGLAVIVVTHQRKSGGEGGEAIRGSSAIAGAADILIEVERAGEDAPQTARRIVAVGRFADIPPVRVVDFDPATRAWRVLGDVPSRSESASLAWRDRLLSALPSSGPRATYGDLEDALSAPKRTWRAELDALCESGLVERVGNGVKGDPYLFLKAAADSGGTSRGHASPESPETVERAVSDSGGHPLRGPGIRTAPPLVSVPGGREDPPETVEPLTGVRWESHGGAVGHWQWDAADGKPF